MPDKKKCKGCCGGDCSQQDKNEGECCDKEKDCDCKTEKEEKKSKD
jgi:hypothetical protein